MANEISTAHIKSYHNNFELLNQQMGSRLVPTVTTGTQKSDTDFFDQVGEVITQKKTTRHSATPRSDTPHRRRAISLESYRTSDLIDKEDEVKMLDKPYSTYAQAQVVALGRDKDRVIINAATGVSRIGKDGTGTEPYPITMRVPSNYVLTGAATASNLTLDKLLRGRELLLQKEAITPGEMVTCALSASQEMALLRDDKLSSNEYNIIRSLVAGEVTSFLGLNFVRTELLNKTGNDREILIYPKSAIRFNESPEGLFVDIKVMPSDDYSTQVYARIICGSTRMNKDKVVSILCDETK